MILTVSHQRFSQQDICVVCCKKGFENRCLIRGSCFRQKDQHARGPAAVFIYARSKLFFINFKCHRLSVFGLRFLFYSVFILLYCIIFVLTD